MARVGKGIVLAGGSGSRLGPLTTAVSKQLHNIGGKPMVYYPLTTLFFAGIRDILLITTPDDLAAYQRLLGDGHQWGVRIQYAAQPKPEGLAQAFLIGEQFLAGQPAGLVLGDNVFYGHGFPDIVAAAADLGHGGRIFASEVTDPGRYGVVEFDTTGRVLSIEEKPSQPKSDFAVVGLYFYDDRVVEFTKQLQPSDRNELEITALNQRYLDEGELEVQILGRGIAYLDTGTPDAMEDASHFISIIQRRQGLMVACPEEVALHMDFITFAEFRACAERLRGCPYGQELLKIVRRREQHPTAT